MLISYVNEVFPATLLVCTQIYVIKIKVSQK
jgi:hypothetical protein